MPKKSYEDWRHDLDTKMLRESGREGQQAQDFVTQTFREIYTAYQAKQITHAEYVKLINRMGSYKNKQFNDYIDLLAGSAQFGMLDMLSAASENADLAGPARSRQRGVTGLTGMKPVDPEKDMQ